jgi:hypothetical protein
MPSNYAAIREDNVKRYGTDISRIGPMLLANRYDNQAHFIYELLQNAEDAVRRRRDKNGSRAVEFLLKSDALQFSHYGELFTDKDVKGICGIAESTKSEELTTIGRFGIGFKAVYAFTDYPEIHSGDEHFAIDSYVWPRETAPVKVGSGQTIFRFPFREGDASTRDEILVGLRSLTSRSLLFLREIEEIHWSTANGMSGTYLRQLEQVSDTVRRVTFISETSGAANTQMERWLVFSREVGTQQGHPAGNVEIAFYMGDDPNDRLPAIQAIKDSTLVVFFPTVLSTNLGFLLQGPFRTTPSRDNVPQQDPWNQFLVGEASSLIVEALNWLKENNLLTVDALRTLPIDGSKFQKGAMLQPLFESVRSALGTEELLPAFRSGYTSGNRAKLARTKEIREVFSGDQLGMLYDSKGPISWLSEDITVNRVPELRNYLMSELAVGEIDPDTIIGKVTAGFLESQSDAWMAQYYTFLLGQPGAVKKVGLSSKPIIRLEEGEHVSPFKDGNPMAFLPGPVSTEFPTVKQTICDVPSALEFLKQLGLQLPDTVDDVVVHVLPKYKAGGAMSPPPEYESDIVRILFAASTDSKKAKDKIQAALRNAYFVASIDMGDGSRVMARPGRVYQSTQKLRTLFKGVSGVLMVDDSLSCLARAGIRELLEGAGASEYLQTVPIENIFSVDELAEMRYQGGCAQSSGNESIENVTLRGLETLLDLLPTLPPGEAFDRSKVLWEALCDVEDRRGAGVFTGTYYWTYYHPRSHAFDAYFVTLLNEESWVPSNRNELVPPHLVQFEDIPSAWKPNPFLQSKIKFKPAIIDTLAKEAGIEPAVLDFLKRNGITSEAELKARLKPQDEAIESDPQFDDAETHQDDATKSPSEEPIDESNGDGNASKDEPEKKDGSDYVPDRPSRDVTDPYFGGTGASNERGKPDRDRHGSSANGGEGNNGGGGGQRTFVSYVSVRKESTDEDGDGGNHEKNLALEEKAISLILSEEPELIRTPTNNPGYDLYQESSIGDVVRYVEVKAMAGAFRDRAVCLSKAQFELAQKYGMSYWLYVVESMDNPEAPAKIIQIQDPAGKARSFSFDHGWKESVGFT